MEHGTATAGIALARQDGSGTAGIAPNLKYDEVRIFRRDPRTGVEVVAADNDIANGIIWAYQHGDILNNSWGGCGAPSATITDAVLSALQAGRGGKGSIVIFSAGNSGQSGCGTGQTWQSQIPGVIAVAALARDGSQASYSLTGSHITVSAFGGDAGTGPGCFDGELGGADIVTTDLSFGHDCANGPQHEAAYTTGFGGTSAAAPQVAGVAALLLSREPNLYSPEVTRRIQAGADPWGPGTVFGAGKLNAYATLVSVSDSILGPVSVTPPCNGFPTCHGQSYTWTGSASAGNGTFSYQWKWKPCGQTLTNLGTTSSQSITLLPTSPDFFLQVVASSGGRQTTSTIFVDNTIYQPLPGVTCSPP